MGDFLAAKDKIEIGGIEGTNTSFAFNNMIARLRCQKIDELRPPRAPAASFAFDSALENAEGVSGKFMVIICEYNWNMDDGDAFCPGILHCFNRIGKHVGFFHHGLNLWENNTAFAGEFVLEFYQNDGC